MSEDYDVQPSDSPSGIFSGASLPPMPRGDQMEAPPRQTMVAVEPPRPVVSNPVLTPMPPPGMQFSGGFGQDVVPQEGAHMLGVSLFLVGIGAVVGAKYGGAYGAGAGGLIGGAAVNAFRAMVYYRKAGDDPANKKEALVSATYAAIGGGVGAYLWYTLVHKPGLTKNTTPSETREAPSSKPPGVSRKNASCKIRPAGP